MPRVRDLVAIVSALMLAAACGGRTSDSAPEKAGSAPPEQQQPAAIEDQPDPAPDGEGLQPDRLLRDVLAYQLCRELSGTLQGLSSGEGQDKVVEGRLWMQSCDARVDGETLEIDLGGRGFRWISRERSKLGATFKVDQYVRFEVEFGARFDVEAEYARDDRMLIVWLRPREITNVNLQTIGDIDVEEGMWGDVLGTVSDVWGGSPEEKAEKSVEQKGEGRFMQALGEGYTIALDLCSGQNYTERDILDVETVVEAPRELEDDEATVRIHPGGIDAFGPSEDAPIAFDLTAQQGNVRADLYCHADAARLLNAYFAGESLPEIEPLAQAYVTSAQPSRIATEEATCPVYLVVQPSDGSDGTVLYKYSAHDRPAMPEPYIRCQK